MSLQVGGQQCLSLGEAAVPQSLDRPVDAHGAADDVGVACVIATSRNA
jgi:hypothetical protein